MDTVIYNLWFWSFIKSIHTADELLSLNGDANMSIPSTNKQVLQ
jgi:hypothetical protein